MKSFRRSLLLGGLGCMLAWPLTAFANEPAPDPELLSAAPADVVALAGREVGCRHWLNADITDQESDARVEQALSHLRCDSLAAEIATLRHKYAQSKSALKALDAARDLGP